MFFVGMIDLFSASRAVSQVIVWGDNTYGETNVPASATNVIALAGCDSDCLALRGDGTVVAWGQAGFIGVTNVPSGLTNAVGIAAGSGHALALRADGTITMWGQNFPNGIFNVPPTVTNVVALALGSGQQHTLVLRADGTIVDWGSYNGSANTNIPPTARNIVSVATGSYHSVVLRSDGHLVAWGDNSQGQTIIPTAATNIVAIAAGWFGNVALRADGTNLYWGSISVPSPVPHNDFTNVIDIACPASSLGFAGSCSILALRRGGTVVEYSASVPSYVTNIVAVGAYSAGGMALVGSGPPAFPQKLLNRSVAVGATAYFRMLAVGALPLSYQWTCNGTNIPAATNSILVVANVQPGQVGNYYSLIASNALGMATNNASTLNATPSEVYIQPQAVSAMLGSSVTFTAKTNGQGPFTYQWLFNGASLDSATNISLTCYNVQLTNAGSYSVVVTNAYGTATASATLTVQPIVFNTGPTNLLFATNGMWLQLDGVFATNSVILYASTDLVSWLPILTNSAATGSVRFVDSSATNLPLRFYRTLEK